MVRLPLYKSLILALNCNLRWTLHQEFTLTGCSYCNEKAEVTHHKLGEEMSGKREVDEYNFEEKESQIGSSLKESFTVHLWWEKNYTEVKQTPSLFSFWIRTLLSITLQWRIFSRSEWQCNIWPFLSWYNRKHSYYQVTAHSEQVDSADTQCHSYLCLLWYWAS